MNTLEIARKFMAVNETAEAAKAYKLVLNELENPEPAVEFECALNILQFGKNGDYKISFTTFVSLYNRGFEQSDIMDIMRLAFYQPNARRLKKQYEKNCRLLRKYPYFFRRDFPAFEDLPLRFFPYADNQYMPFDVSGRRFGDFYDPGNQVISRNFFRDLEKPILAADVFSQYELEYLHDNVRPSEWVAKENHIYLHYTSWPVFCAYLQCLDLLPLLKDNKIVFLIEDELKQYPIDFKQRFGIDYSQYEVKPLGIREITRLIWHTQLSAHNGGDFFNEIFDSHPNLLAFPSVMFESVEETISYYKKIIDKSMNKVVNIQNLSDKFSINDEKIFAKLCSLHNCTDKDIFVAICLCQKNKISIYLQDDARIVPAIFFQPHFYIINYTLKASEHNLAMLYSEEYDKIKKSSIFSGFKYIKTFTPMRRFTTSHGASMKFAMDRMELDKESVMSDLVLSKVLNRSFMIDWQDRLFKDCRLVRFEDGKLNPKATFTALAAFLDLPYTESLTYCSEFGRKDPESMPGNDIGFDPAAIYRTYDDYTNDTERTFIEYFLRDAYEYYGYDFQYYDGQSVDQERVKEWLNGFSKVEFYMNTTRTEKFMQQASDLLQEKQQKTGFPREITPQIQKELADQLLAKHMQQAREIRCEYVEILMRGLHFVNRSLQPLHMMPKLELDPALLERPLYR